MRLPVALGAVLLAALLGAGAHAQTLIQAGPMAPGHVPMYLNGGAQPFVQDSGPASGGVPGLGLTELLLTERGTGAAPYANAGSGPFGTNLCDYDAPITNPAGYHFLCFGPNAQGGGLIAYGAGGAATPEPLQINVNGTNFSFPGTGTGNVSGPISPYPTVGDIVKWNGGTTVADSDFPIINLLTGPGSATINDLACWNNNTGTALNDCGTQVGLVTIYGILNPVVSNHASGSANSYTGSIGATSRNLTIAGTPDIGVGEGIEIEAAGTANTAVTPTVLAAAAPDWNQNGSTEYLIGAVIRPLTGNAGNKYYEVRAGYAPLAGCSEVGTTATCIASNYQTLVFGAGASVTIAGSTVSGYNGTFTVTSFDYNQAASEWEFSFTAAGSLSSGSGGTVQYTGSGGVNAAGGITGQNEPGTWNQSSAGTQADGSVLWQECTGTCNSNSYVYTLVARDINRAFAAPSGAVTCSNATLSLLAACVVTWTPAANDQDIVVCRAGVAVAIVPAADGSYTDIGTALVGLHPDVPSNVCTAGPKPGPLVTSVSAIPNAGSYTLAAAATSTVSGAVVVHDDTAALNALATALLTGANGQQGYCPNGTYLTTAPWLFDGEAAGPGWGFTLTGSNGTSRQIAGCHVVYHGPALASTVNHGVMVLDGVNSSQFTDLALDNNGVATAAVQITNSDNTHVSSGVTLTNVYAADVPQTNYASGFAIGFNGCGGYQVSELTFNRIQIEGMRTPGINGRGLRSWCGSNQKNFTIEGIECSDLNYCVSTVANGYVKVADLIESNETGYTFQGVTEVAVVDGGEAEDEPGARLFSFSASGSNPAQLMIENFSWQTAAPPDGSVGVLGGVPSLVSQNNQFYDGPNYYEVGGAARVSSTGDYFNGDLSAYQIVQDAGAPLNCNVGGGGASYCNQVVTVTNASGAGTPNAVVALNDVSSAARHDVPLQLAVTGTATAGTAACAETQQGMLKIVTCALIGYQQTGTAQTVTFATAFSTFPTLLEGASGANSCGTYNPTVTATVLTLPANASMTAESCTVTAIGQ